MHTTWLSITVLMATMATALEMAVYSTDLDQDFVVSNLPVGAPATEPTELKVVDTVLPLTKGEGQSLSAYYVRAIRDAAQRKRGISRLAAGVTPLNSISSSIYTAPITVGGNTYQMVIDTGSSDPWLASTTFSCIDPDSHAAEPQSTCAFGPLYDPSKSTTYSPIANQNFNVTYADGENLNGNMAYETFSIAGIAVTGQEFGVVTKAAWYGDGASSGLVGFAYSTLTSAYAGTNPATDVRSQRLIYPTLFQNIYQKQLAAPIFSLALSRDPNTAGLLAIGGIPNVQHSTAWVTAPIQPVGVNSTTKQLVYQFYSIVMDGWALSTSQSAQFDVAGTGNRLKTQLIGNGTQIIVDSGTSLLYAPDDFAASVAAAFNPPAAYDEYLGAYTVDCSATAPLFGISISKKVFYVNPLDMFLPTGDSGLCYSSIQPNGGGLVIVGDVWLKNVLAVFDIGAQQMRFSAREYYSTPACSGINCVGTS